ncbi:hypothetical protein QE152_g38003 [Popillia japonica]|uniref:Uncharacterized protein n=1 Tax=Popillia japonica TaxID=7064 RepID=A0AAW1I933_POPJA
MLETKPFTTAQLIHDQIAPHSNLEDKDFVLQKFKSFQAALLVLLEYYAITTIPLLIMSQQRMIIYITYDIMKGVLSLADLAMAGDEQQQNDKTI